MLLRMMTRLLAAHRAKVLAIVLLQFAQTTATLLLPTLMPPSLTTESSKGTPASFCGW
ncbi:ABC transporter protein, partial [Arthrobacter sp. Hiyo6]